MPRTSTLLLMGGPEYHNKVFHYAELSGILAGEAGADLRVTDDLDVLNSKTLASFQVIVNWSTFLEPTDEQVQALLGAVENGVGLLALHGGNATFWNSAPYLTALGSRFIRHAPYKHFQVEIDDRSHPITAGVDNFETDDELYEIGGKVEDFPRFADAIRAGQPRAELRPLGDGPLPSDCHVLASAEGHPLLYVKPLGRGRVHYNALGHDLASLTNPSYRHLIRQGFAWVAG
ncbi:MAG TPA: ThuA domain-containing protein [Chloroflexota bacterium]|nr:ThuA domain-containing protein [Chloroflexota bacterium]